MLARLKFVTGEMGAFLWPLIKQFLCAAAPVLAEAAKSAVKVVAMRYADRAVENSQKHQDARGLIISDLQQRGIQIGTDVTNSMIDLAIKAAVKGLQ